jgi:hypothetical protein
LRLDRVDVVDAKRQHVLVVDGIDDGVGVQLVAKGLRGGAPQRVAGGAGVLGKDGRAGEAEQVIALEHPGDFGVHVAELAAVAFVEDHHHMRVIHRVLLVLGHEAGKLLDGGDDDARVRVFQLPLQHRRGRVRVGRAFLEALVFAHGLVVQILAIHHEQHLVDVRQASRQLRRLEAGQRFAAAGGVPDVAARRHRAQLLVIGGGGNALQDALGGHDLVGPHHQQLAIHIEHAVFGEDVQQRMLGEEGLGEAGQLGDGLVLRIGPPAGEGKAVGGLALAALAGLLLQMPVAHGVAVVLGQRAIADDEQLHILEQARARPEAVALVAVDLVEGLADVHAPALQFDVHHRQAVDQHGHIEAGGTRVPAFSPTDLVLVDDLQGVVVDVGLVDQVDVLGSAVVALQDLNMVFLNARGFFQNAVVGAGDAGGEESFPLGIGECDLVELFQLTAQVGDQLGFRGDGQVVIGLKLQLLDEGLFQRGFALIGGLAHARRIGLNSATTVLSLDSAIGS